MYAKRDFWENQHMCHIKTPYFLKETWSYAKRDLCTNQTNRQERPTYVSKKTYENAKRDVCDIQMYQRRLMPLLQRSHKRPVCMSLLAKRDLHTCQKRPMKILNETNAIFKCIATARCLFCKYVKRDLYVCQKRHMYTSKETYMSLYESLQRDASTAGETYMLKETYRCMKRDLYVCQRRPI